MVVVILAFEMVALVSITIASTISGMSGRRGFLSPASLSAELGHSSTTGSSRLASASVNS